MAALLAAGLFANAGAEMINLESQAGNTVAEAFYNAMGVFAFGMAALSVAVAAPSPQWQHRVTSSDAATIDQSVATDAG